MEPAAPSPFAPLPPRGSRRTGRSSAAPAGTADLPSAVPDEFPPVPPPSWGRPGGGESQTSHSRNPSNAHFGVFPCPQGEGGSSRKAIIENLRRSIEAIERPSLTASQPSSSTRERPLARPLWRLDAGAAFPLPALEAGCVHEVKPRLQGCGASAGDWMASLGFSLRLAVRRMALVRDAGEKGALILWCSSRSLAGELGRPSWHGLAALGFDPAQVLIVETAREEEALAALEEGLRSPALALAIGAFEDVDLNPARRLSLAAGVAGVPCLLATHPARPPAAATATRWRIAREASAPHPFDPRAPGNARFAVMLERCRSLPGASDRPPVVLEWCDETHAFRLAARVADHASRTRGTRLRTGA